jgi:hypothetical protein
MRHPSTRAERRYAREVARNRRRAHQYLYWLRPGEDPRESSGWNRGGKQYFACGNRCGHRWFERYARRREVKRLRGFVSADRM